MTKANIRLGLEILSSDTNWQKKVRGNIAYLCHSASIDSSFVHGVYWMQKIFKERFVKIIGPQHGFMTDVQDNMVETKDFLHPYFKIPVLSLYADTRRPTKEMLEGIDTIVIDLQDVGTRVYTYISTMTLVMEEAAKYGITVMVLDRPNPVGGNIIEGNILEEKFTSFVGRHPIPMRHSLTMGEMALWANKFMKIDCKLEVVPMHGWKREMFYKDTNLSWVLPSPNLPTMDGAIVFVGSVLFEGTNISEGRGTTRSLEVFGHPKIESYGWSSTLNKCIAEEGIRGCFLRPINFFPMFQKHKEVACGGFQIHVTDCNIFRPWALGQLLLRELKKYLKDDFLWKQPPYEYEYEKLPIDLINGSTFLREWIEEYGRINDLFIFERKNLSDFIEQKKIISLY